MEALLLSLKENLATHADTQIQLSTQRFFKESIKCYGIKSAIVEKIGKEYFKNIKNLSKKTVFDLCTTLWQSGSFEENMIACHWSYNVHKLFQPDDIKLFEFWIDNYITNWATCDTFCNHTVGTYLEMYPQYLPTLSSWANSENRWKKRASAVSLIVPAKKGLFLESVLVLATQLLQDSDDMVQKGYGWMLKSAAHTHQKEVFDFVVQYKATMPRTALRYAIEKMPKGLKDIAMAK